MTLDDEHPDLMTSDGEQPDRNPLLMLCEKQKQLLTRSLAVMLGACAIAFLITDGLVHLSFMHWVWIVDVGVLIYYKVSYRRAVKHFDSAIETPQEAYCNAKTRQYIALVMGINANSVAMVLCPAVWMFLASFVLWVVLFFTLPKITDLRDDFGGDDI